MFGFFKDNDKEIRDLQNEIYELKILSGGLEDENENLKAENQRLKDRVLALEARISALEGPHARQWENILNYNGKPRNGPPSGLVEDSEP